MLVVVSNAINQFYKKKDYQAFKAGCFKYLELFKELQNYIALHNLSFDEGPQKPSPVINWYLNFGNYKKNGFEISYNTVIKISKVAPLFYIQHEFEIENKDEDRMSPLLEGSSGQPYTKKQADLHDEVAAIFNEKGYQELMYADLTETVAGFQMPKGITIFGPNVTVELLLFADIFDLCSK